jgi:carboxypeptidase family protein
MKAACCLEGWPARRRLAARNVSVQYVRKTLLSTVVVGLMTSGALAAQTIEGRVLDDRDDRPVATAFVRLVDEAGESSGVTIADSLGFYRIEAPTPGVYRLEAERIGFDPFETPPLEVSNEDGVYPVDLLMRRSPLPIGGFEVTTEQIDKRLRTMTGLDPRGMRWDPFRRTDLVNHAERGHDLTAMMRWSNLGGVEVFEYTDGPCYLVRRYGCMKVYLNGMELTSETVDMVPLDMLETVVVLSPNESIIYGRGAVLLYTEAWIR